MPASMQISANLPREVARELPIAAGCGDALCEVIAQAYRCNGLMPLYVPTERVEALDAELSQRRHMLPAERKLWGHVRAHLDHCRIEAEGKPF